MSAMQRRKGATRPHKYNARKAYRCAKCGGTWHGEGQQNDCGGGEKLAFDSGAEAKRWDQLRLLERAGKINALSRQVPFQLEVWNGRKAIHVADYRADFVYDDVANGDVRRVEDIKGVDTPVSRLKRTLVEAQYGIKIDVIRT